MDRQRSVSETQPCHQVLPSPRCRRRSNEWKSIKRLPDQHPGDQAARLAAEYRFHGQVVTYKASDHYGFICSDQVEGDVFFGLNQVRMKLDKNSESCPLLHKKVSFNVDNVGKKSMEARKVELMTSDCGPQLVEGRVIGWEEEHCNIQVTSGKRGNMFICLTSPVGEVVGLDVGQVGIRVTFQLRLGKGFKVWAWDVKRIGGMQEVNDNISPSEGGEKGIKSKKVMIKRIGGMPEGNDNISPSEGEKGIKSKKVMKSHLKRKDSVTEIEPEASQLRPLSEDTLSVKQVTSDEFSEELISEIRVMDASSLSCLFHRQLKVRLSSLVQQQVGSKLVVAVVRRAAQLGGANIEDKITRMVMANILASCSTKQGSSVVQACLELCSAENKLMIAEQMVEFDSREQFTDLWVHGSQVFTLALSLLDENSLAQVGFTLCDHYVFLAMDIRYYKPVRALLTRLAGTECFVEILPELERQLTTLSCNKFGHFVVSALLENTTPPDQVRLISTFQGQVADLAHHPVCHAVLVTAVLVGSPGQQAALIEEICTVPPNQADMAVVDLTRDKFGHTVVLAMLKVSRHRQVHNLLKASILCKQEELIDNEYAAKVLNTIKTEFHNRA